MTARFFHCEIVNQGEAPIEWIDDGIEHGDWVDDNVPSETAKLIQPGQTGHYEAESDGDIPIVGNIMTGTEGWALFKTKGASGVTEFIKINHNLPYWAPPNSWHPVWHSVSRFDPRIQPGAAEFDTRDKSDPDVRVRKMSEDIGSGNTLTEIQSLPWIIAYGFATWGGINAFARFHCHIKLKVTGSAATVSTPLFGDTEPPPAPAPKPYRFSSPSLWSGVWDGDTVTAVISVSPSGLLDVEVIERNPGQPDQTYSGQNLPISRTFAHKLAEMRHAVLASLDQEMRNSVVTALESREDSRGLMFEVQRLAGDERFASTFISADHRYYGAYREIGARFVDNGGWRPTEIGGDFVRLPDDAILEIHSLVSGGYTLGYALRYRRPSSGPLLFMANAASARDEMLYRRMVVR